jgi:hypothetical protein
MGNIKIFFLLLVPFIAASQNYPRFELYQLVQGQDSGQFIVTDSDSNLVFSNLLKLRFSPDTALIFNGDTIAVKTDLSFPTFLAGLGITIEFDSDLNQYYIESLAIEDTVFNNSFVDIPKGTPVYAVGGQGRDYWSVDVADASDPNKMPVIGIAEDVLPARDWGKLLIKGHITNVPTTGLDEGAEVYVAVGGGYTDEIPKGENVIIQRLGTVIKGNKNNGSGIINLGDPVTAPNLNPDRIFIGDVDSNVTRINLYTAIKDTASVLVSDSLTNYASRTELADSLYLYPNRTELADTANNIRLSIPIQIGDSLTNYASRTELADTANNIRLDIPTYISDSLLNYVSRIELGDSLYLYPNRTELGDTALAIRNTIPIQIGDSLVNYASRTELADTSNNIRLSIPIQIGDSLVNYSSRTELQDTASAIRADFPAAGGDVTTAQLADTASAIRGDIPRLPLTLGTQTDGNYVATATTSGNGISGSATGEGSTFTVTSNATTNNTANTIVFRNASGNFSAGTITATLSGNSSTATKLQTSRVISLTSDVTGGASFDGSANASITATVVDDSHNHIISNVDFLSDSLTALRTAINAAGGGGGLWSEGATPGEIYYNSGNVGIGNTDPDYPLHVTGDGYFTDDLLVFDRIYIGSDFNHTSVGYSPYIDRYAATGETGMDFYAYMSNSSFPLYRFIDSYDSYSTVFQLNPAASTYQAVINGKTDLNGNLTQSGTIVQDGGTVTFNNTQGNYDFGVGSANYLPFMWVDASADRMAVGGGTPDYTLDVTGDINFTGDLYDDGSLVSFTETTINNNAANSIISGSNTANTLEAYANINVSNLPKISFYNATTGNTSTDGTDLSYVSGYPDDFIIHNHESTGTISLVINNSIDFTVKSDGSIQILDLTGVSDVGADANGVLQAATSDTTLKTNILPNKYGLKKVMDLETIKFNWKDKKSKGSQNEVGFNAQNLQKVIPEATYTIPSNGKLGIKDDAIIATLTKAIQEQQEMIEELQKEIKRIKRKIK